MGRREPAAGPAAARNRPRRPSVRRRAHSTFCT